MKDIQNVFSSILVCEGRPDTNKDADARIFFCQQGI